MLNLFTPSVLTFKYILLTNTEVSVLLIIVFLLSSTVGDKH